MFHESHSIASDRTQIVSDKRHANIEVCDNVVGGKRRKYLFIKYEMLASNYINYNILLIGMWYISHVKSCTVFRLISIPFLDIVLFGKYSSR